IRRATLQGEINWFGLAGSITIFLLIIISLFVPWWQLTVGDDIVKANASPLNTNFNFAGDVFTIPIIWALNIGSIISLAAGGIAIMIYSIKPTRSYSKRLLGFGYRKPLYSLLFFMAGLILITVLVKSIFGLDVPLVGSSETMLPKSMTQGITIAIKMAADFIWPFWLAIMAAGLCIAARIYHKKIASAEQTAKQPSAPPQPLS
ncbi:MAG: hypothetical protein QXD70_03920, partial [Candidatus Bathyarchaeia archaeon]